MMLFNTLLAFACCVPAQDLPPGGTPVLNPDSLFSTPIGGLSETGSRSSTVPVPGIGFDRALRVSINRATTETNTVQLTLANSERVEKGDALLAKIWFRGRGASGAPARLELLFEKSTNPWTKSASRAGIAKKDASEWRQVVMPIQSMETYRPQEAMLSIRLAMGIQTIELGGLELVNYRKSRSLDELVTFASTITKVGSASVTVNPARPRQTMLGLGGNFCQPRYGKTEPMDQVGDYVLTNLTVSHARVGLPLNHWNPSPGVYRDEAQAKAAFEALQLLSRRKLPIVLSAWEGPTWMTGGQVEQMGRTLAPDKIDPCIDSIVRFLVVARDKYKVPVEFFSFNEPDYGVNFKFTSAQMVDFIRRAGPRFAKAGLKTKFIVADTANGSSFAAYAKPILEAADIAKYLGPLAFHSWDALGASEASYRAIAALGKEYKKQVWCLEAGHDAQLWQKPNPWGTWENALQTARAYERTIRLTEASLMDYWTYQDNYTIVDPKTIQPYPVFKVLKQIEAVFTPGSVVVDSQSTSEDLQVTVAQKGKSGRKWSALLVNPVGEGTVTFNRLGRSARVKVVTSTEKGQLVTTQPRASQRGSVTIPVPARSVVTVHINP